MKKIEDVDKKTPDISDLVTTSILNTKICEVKSKIPNTSSLVTTTFLNTKVTEFKNKIPNTTTTTVLNTKISEFENKIPNHDKYIATPEFNKLTAESFASRLKQADLVNKIDFDNKLTSFNKRVT